MAIKSRDSLWEKPAWREPEKWAGVNKLIRQLQVNLEKLRLEVEADVLAFYLACDPFVSNYLSCLASLGANYGDACSHFVTVADGNKGRPFFEDAMSDPARSGHNDDERVAAVMRQRSDPLFGDFVVREGIVSRGRLSHSDSHSGRITALLTVNFRRRVTEQQWSRVASYLEHQFDRIVIDNASNIRQKLQKKSEYLLSPFFGMLETLDPLSQHMPASTAADIMKSLLQQAIPPLDADGRKWCGTVHRLTADNRALELIASEGNFPAPERTAHELAKGEGVISWVALRKQAVRIKEMETSPFKTVSVEYLSGIRSQLAVPILIRDRLWGTLSLEATKPDVFRRQEVGYLTRVASLAAMAALQAEYDQVCEERGIYLEAIYAAKRRELPPEPLPSFEQLLRESALGSSAP